MSELSGYLALLDRACSEANAGPIRSRASAVDRSCNDLHSVHFQERKYKRNKQSSSRSFKPFASFSDSADRVLLLLLPACPCRPRPDRHRHPSPPPRAASSPSPSSTLAPCHLRQSSPCWILKQAVHLLQQNRRIEEGRGGQLQPQAALSDGRHAMSLPEHAVPSTWMSWGRQEELSFVICVRRG